MKIKLIECKSANEAEEFERPLCVCDFRINDAENGTIKEYGLIYKSILNIDHHAPIPEMERAISSTNLAIIYVTKNGPVKTPIIINHTDCDSVLSSMIASGMLEPLDIYGNAAIAADHTGEENQIADLLQALDPLRNFDYSATELRKILAGERIETKSAELLEKRLVERSELKKLAPNFKYTSNGVAYLQSENRISGEFLPAMFPTAKVIIVGIPIDNEKLEIKVRLGRNFDKVKLNKLELPDFGGRWNAGSTKRHGGTSHSLEEYANIIDSKLTNQDSQNN